MLRYARLLSFFIYLSGCEAGGRTPFPRLRESFAPSLGGGIVWYNLDRAGVPDDRTLHAGEPVLSGEKWGLNIWLRERPRPIQPRVRVALKPTAQRVALTLSVDAPRAKAVAAAAPCAGCGERATPLGLCLCRANYALPGGGAAAATAEPREPPPAPERVTFVHDTCSSDGERKTISLEPGA